MSRTTPVELTILCLVYDEDRILVQEKTGTKYRGGLVLPGGHVEADESIAEAVIREIREETGLTVRNPKLCGVKDWCEEDGVRYLVLLYKTNQFDGVLTSSKEGRVFWLNRQEVADANFIWNMREVLEIMEGDRYTEFFFRRIGRDYTEELIE